MPSPSVGLFVCPIWRVETWVPGATTHDIRGYYSALVDANGAAQHYRDAEKVNSTITTLELADALERDDLCHRLNRGLK